MYTLDLKFPNGREMINFYIIGDGPSEINSKEHRTWGNIKTSPAVKLLYVEQLDVVAEAIEKSNAT